MRTVTLFLTGLLFSMTAYADRGAYTISSFDVELTVEPNADLVVEERLEVEFSESRHGIYRSIPVRYTDPRGYLYSLDFRLLEVVDDEGASYRADVSREGRYVSVRIGDPETTVIGRVVYVIRYRIRGMVAHFPEHDELYWNATGNEWEARIESASATVRLPAPVDFGSLEAAAHTGRFGSQEQEADVELLPDGVVRYRGRGALEPLEGLTVVAAWPHGLVSFPGPGRRAARFVAENWVVLFPLLSVGFLWHRYRASGRDPEGPAAVVVRYEPPPNLAPGEIGALVDESVDPRDITATVVDLAVRGYLRIRIEEKERWLGLFNSEETYFDLLNSDWGGLRDFERKVLTALFETGHEVSAKDLEHKFYRHIPAIQDAVWEDLAQRRYVSRNPRSVRKQYKTLGIVAGGLTIGAGYLWAKYLGAAFPHAMIFPVLSGIAVALLFFVFSPAMPRRTRAGVASRAWAKGFEEFVDRVERDKLEADRIRNVFEALLPYAMALGVAARWAERFADIYTAAPPTWFTGSHVSSGFSTPRFERSLSSAMTRASAGMTAAPRSSGSSGSGGGGFSGGGGGGGGGGSW